MYTYQELAPHYREAAKLLQEMDLPTPVVLAKYNDGDEYNRRLRAGSPEMYNYSAYPALLVFQDGEHNFIVAVGNRKISYFI